MRQFGIAFLLSAVTWTTASAQSRKKPFSHADTLRGSNGPGRAWWDAAFYDLHVTVIRPTAASAATTRSPIACSSRPSEMQIDLQVPLEVDSMVQDGQTLDVPSRQQRVLRHARRAAADRHAEDDHRVLPRQAAAAKRPPWDGGFIWQRDSLGNRWVATANEGLGASAWWPNKDYAGRRAG